jgi:hypothetical protein
VGAGAAGLFDKARASSTLPEVPIDTKTLQCART